jgi:hypothetical protein
MSNGRNKYQSRENRAQVRRVLMDEWDPIGVRDAPEAQDEYDRYVAEVYVMLMDQRATPGAIAAHLYDRAINYIGVPDRPEVFERSRRAAELLTALRPSFETH